MSLYTTELDGTLKLNLHAGQALAWESEKRFVFVIAGTQGGKTSFGPFWLYREIQRMGRGDYLAVTSNYDLFKLKLLPEIRAIFEDVLGIGRYWAGERILEICNLQTREFSAKRSDDPMWGRIILRSAAAKGGLESSTAKAAWLDECGQPEFTLDSYEAVIRRLSIHRGRIFGSTTPYDLGWLLTHIVKPWKQGDPDIDVIRFSSVINPAFPREEFEDRQRKMSPWRFKMMYRGIFTRPAGMIYGDFKNKYKEDGGHKVHPFNIPAHWPKTVGVDPSGINTALVWIAYDPEGDAYYQYRESLDAEKSTREHVEDALEVAEFAGEKVTAWYVGAKSETQQRLDWEDYGAYPVYEPPTPDVEAGIDKIIELLRSFRFFIFDTCEGTIDQFSTYSRELDDENKPTEKIKNKNIYHFLDALRYDIVGVTYVEDVSWMRQAPVKGR